jgi:quaternary ammonium compound-resistance protein SugE
MSWILLIVSGLFEVLFSTSLKMSENFSKLSWSVLTLISLVASVMLLSRTLHEIPVGTAYAVWTGIGGVGTVLVGMLFFQESTDFWRIFFIVTLILSLIGLKFVSAE